MKLAQVVCTFCMTMIFLMESEKSFAESGKIRGKITKLKTHQYLNDAGWDKQAWFCLDNTRQIGNCGKHPECNNAMGLTISKNAHPEIFSMVVSAQLSQTTLEVYVDDRYQFENFCYAHIITVSAGDTEGGKQTP